MPREPAVSARWVFRSVAGEAPGPARRILGGVAVSLLVIALSVAVPISVLVSLSAIALLLGGIAVPEASLDGPTIAWGLVAVTMVVFVGTAAAVSWTSGRRTVHREGRISPVSANDREQAGRSEVEEERATHPPEP